jgi:hypothetical protein
MTQNDGWEKLEMSPTWDYKNQKELIGTFVGAETGIGPNNSNMYKFKTEKGIVGVWGTTLLDTRLKNLEPGEEVKLVYLGKKPSPKRKGSYYHDFEVYHRKPVKQEETDDGDVPF